MLCASLVVLFYSVKTVDRNWDWGNALSLAESAVPVNPSNAKVFMTIGNHYAQHVSVIRRGERERERERVRIKNKINFSLQNNT